MYPQVETTQAPLEMTLEETLDVRGAGTWADVGQAIGQVIDTAIAVVATVS
ncbi:hypothetical protein ACIPZF_05480 [Pseudomonas sp. NPDC089752]|uniref:hypothetical protein n=1 Tax=Pseudomonas sp. NPDC089752 TaxID=3364472 RepID=UPI003805F0B5